MTISLDTSIPLDAVYDGPNWVERQRTAQEFEQRQKALELRLAELKAARDADVLARRQRAGKSAYEQLQGIRQGQPAVMEPEPMLPGPVLNQPAFGAMREKTPAIPGREPSAEDYQRSVADALFREGDYEGAFELLKQMRTAGQSSAMKSFGAETRTGEDGMEYAFNQATGRFEPTGFYQQAKPEPQQRPVQVRTDRGIEFVTPKPGMVLKPPVEQPKPEKPMFTPSQLLDLNMKKQSAFKLVNALDANIAAYREALKGASAMDLANPLSKKRAQIDSLATQLQMAYKNAAELGAITGPDWAIIQRIVDTPGLAVLGKGGVQKLLNQLDEVESLSKRDRKILDEQYSVVPEMPGSRLKKERSIVPAVGYLKSQKITTQAQFNAAVRALKAQGWGDDEIRQAASQAGY